MCCIRCISTTTFTATLSQKTSCCDPNGQLVLVDFGAARQITHTYMAHLGDSGITAVSSAGYTPPEQEQGQAVPQSDFYALGRTLIYLLTARLPNDPAIYDSRTKCFPLAAPGSTDSAPPG